MQQKKKKKKNRKFWNRAEKIVKKEKGKKTLKDDDYALVQHIYQNMLQSLASKLTQLQRIASELDSLEEHDLASKVDDQMLREGSSEEHQS